MDIQEIINGMNIMMMINKKVLEEEYENGLLVYSCPYSNNKRMEL